MPSEHWWRVYYMGLAQQAAQQPVADPVAPAPVAPAAPPPPLTQTNTAITPTSAANPLVGGSATTATPPPAPAPLRVDREGTKDLIEGGMAATPDSSAIGKNFQAAGLGSTLITGDAYQGVNAFTKMKTLLGQ